MTRNFTLPEFFTWPYRLNLSESDKVKATNMMLQHVTVKHIDMVIDLVEELQDIRDDFADAFGETPFIVTCWLRSPEWERYRGRNGSSQHTQGHAVDFVPRKWQKVHRDWMKERLKDWEGGMKVYSWGVHIDFGQKRRW